MILTRSALERMFVSNVTDTMSDEAVELLSTSELKRMIAIALYNHKAHTLEQPKTQAKKAIAERLEVSYRSVDRWVKEAQDKGVCCFGAEQEARLFPDT